jgi:hypothetical protein
MGEANRKWHLTGGTRRKQEVALLPKPDIQIARRAISYYLFRMGKQASSKGGKTTVERHGTAHMEKIGRKGFDTTVARHFGGEAKSYVDYLHRRAHESQIEALIDIQLNAELARGKDVACVELPADEEYEPQHWRDRVGRRKDVGEGFLGD